MRKSFIPAHNSTDRDLVMTPLPLAKSIIDHFSPVGSILDPCRGQGAFYKQYPKTEKKDWCEISQGRDFFQYEKTCDWIITNPPWSLIKPFIIHSCKLAKNVCYLITFNHFSTKHRIRILHEMGYGICEFFGVDTPKTDSWPGSGFQLGVVHFQKDYVGSIKVSGKWGH
jgi:hypothetical protein